MDDGEKRNAASQERDGASGDFVQARTSGHYSHRPSRAISRSQKPEWSERLATRGRLKHLAVHVGVVLMIHRNSESEVAFVSVETIARLVGAKPDSVRRSIREIEHAGYIHRQEGTGVGRGNVTHYWFTFPQEGAPMETPSVQPAFTGEKSGPDRGCLSTENPSIGTPKSGLNGVTNPKNRTHKKNPTTADTREADLFADQRPPVLANISPTHTAPPASKPAVEAYNAAAAALNWQAPVRLPLADKRGRALGNVLKRVGLDGWQSILDHASTLPFFDCRQPRQGEHAGWRVSLDFIVAKADFIAEGKYDSFDPFAPPVSRASANPKARPDARDVIRDIRAEQAQIAEAPSWPKH